MFPNCDVPVVSVPVSRIVLISLIMILLFVSVGGCSDFTVMGTSAPAEVIGSTMEDSATVLRMNADMFKDIKADLISGALTFQDLPENSPDLEIFIANLGKMIELSETRATTLDKLSSSIAAYNLKE